MSYPVNQKINPQSMTSTGLSSDAMQKIDSQKLKQDVNQNINENPLVKIVKNDTVIKGGLTFGLWIGIGQLMNRFNRACATQVDEYGKVVPNLLDKVRDFGDSISGHALFQSKKFKSVAGFGKEVKMYLGKILDKSAILRAVIRTPSKPTFPGAKTASLGTFGDTLADAMMALQSYAESDPKGLEKLGLTMQELEEMSKDDTRYVDKVINICRKMKHDEYIEMANGKSYFPVISVVTTPIKKLFRDKILRPKLYQKIFGRRIYFSEIANKLEALRKLKDNTYGNYYLGKVLPKQLLRNMEGFTNGTAGGKIAILFQAGIFADSIISAIKAPKGEKTQTFAEHAVYDVAFYLTIATAIGVIGRFGALKYIGMGKDGESQIIKVNQYREKLDKHNKFAEKGYESNPEKAELKRMRKEIQDLLKGDTKLRLKDEGLLKTAWKAVKNIYIIPLRWFGRRLTEGREAIRSCQKAGTGKVASAFKNSKYWLSKGVGFPIRFILGMMVIMPFLCKLYAKGFHLLFGRPTNSVLDEEKEEPKKDEQNTIVMPVIPQQPTQTQPSSVLSTTPQNGNLIDIYKAKSAPTMTAPSQGGKLVDAYKAKLNNNSNISFTGRNLVEEHSSHDKVNSQQGENLIDMHKTNSASQRELLTPEEPVRTYIPSSEGVKVDHSISEREGAKVSAVLDKAEIAEELANRFIEG